MISNSESPPALTDWIGGHLRPLHEGVYERRVSDGSYSCWNGHGWNQDAATPAAAAGSTVVSRDQNASWRGLAAPSDQPCATCKGHTVVDRGYDEDQGADLIGECADC